MCKLYLNGNGLVSGADLGPTAAAMDAVVKVFCTHTVPNFSLPWQKLKQTSSFSTGFVIDGRRVLTNAHSVDHYTQVKLKKRGSDTKYAATVLAIGRECDIALLTVEDDEFWKGITPVEFGDLPDLQAAVTVVGYPVGGDTISIDAAINSGNSGGPAFNKYGKCVGIAFQNFKGVGAQNIGYVIPTLVVKRFLQDYEKNGAYTGFPTLEIDVQTMENSDLRMSMGMKADQKGVRLKRIAPTSSGAEVLRASDIILSFDGIDIANDGTVPYRHGERMCFSHLVSEKYSGDIAKFKVLRNSEIFEFDVEMKIHKKLVPKHNKGQLPSYYIIAGLVFTPLTGPYLRSEFGDSYEDVPIKLVEKIFHQMPQSQDEQIVIVSQVLAADINNGYEELTNIQVFAFNGKPVKNLKSLVTMVEGCTDEYLKFDFEYQESVVLRRETAKAATEDILTTNSIPSAMSEDLKLCCI